MRKKDSENLLQYFTCIPARQNKDLILLYCFVKITCYRFFYCIIDIEHSNYMFRLCIINVKTFMSLCKKKRRTKRYIPYFTSLFFNGMQVCHHQKCTIAVNKANMSPNTSHTKAFGLLQTCQYVISWYTIYHLIN